MSGVYIDVGEVRFDGAKATGEVEDWCNPYTSDATERVFRGRGCDMFLATFVVRVGGTSAPVLPFLDVEHDDTEPEPQTFRVVSAIFKCSLGGAGSMGISFIT